MKRLTLVAVLALTGVILCAALPSCSGAQRAAGQQALTCIESAAIKDLEPTVDSILTTGAASWEAQLESLSVGLGMATVNCAVRYAEALWALHEGSGSAATVSLAVNDKLVRAQQWLAKYGGTK